MNEQNERLNEQNERLNAWLKEESEQLDKQVERLKKNKVFLDVKYISDSNLYQKDAMRTCNITDDKEAMLNHAILCLTSEAGECSGILQKVYQGHEFDKEHLKLELGDVLWAVAEACTALDISMHDVMVANIEKLKKRYPEGFTPEKSINRAEGDI